MVTIDLPRPDVPRAIAVVRDFVNTTDHETGIDDLTTPAELSRYLTTEGLLDRPARATRQDLELALRLRSRPAPGAGAEPRRRHGDRARARRRRSPSSPSRSTGPATGPDCGRRPPVSVARWPGSAWPSHEAAAEGIWWRLKICASDECEWAYYDHSKNRSRNWCEYGCGNKLKTRAYRARQAGRSA